MTDLSIFCCQNAACQDFGQRSLDNLTVCDRYGKSDEIRVLRCKSCKGRFSERKGTVYFHAHLAKSEVDNILEHIREGNGIRRTGRLTFHHPDTVSRYRSVAGRHATNLHDELVALSP